MRNNPYVVHICKNTKLPTDDPNYCNNCWIAEDRTNVTTYPPSYLYCPDCEAKGFKNPKTRNVTKTPEQIEAFKQRMLEYRKMRKENDNI